MSERNFKFTMAEANQLRAYIQWAENEGSYYGDKKHFDKRHKRIREAFGMNQGEKSDQRTRV